MNHLLGGDLIIPDIMDQMEKLNMILIIDIQILKILINFRTGIIGIGAKIHHALNRLRYLRR